MGKDNVVSEEGCKILNRLHGRNHLFVIIELGAKGKYAIKVPYSGIPSLWERGDALTLHSEACTMKHIRRMCNAPIPEVFDWNETYENTLGAPYILMRAVTGISARELFNHSDEDFRDTFTKNLVHILSKMNV